jgi:hypothetical protein
MFPKTATDCKFYLKFSLLRFSFLYFRGKIENALRHYDALSRQNKDKQAQMPLVKPSERPLNLKGLNSFALVFIDTFMQMV